MKVWLIALGLFVICALLVFAPHHRRIQYDDRPCTLGQIYAAIFSSVYDSLVDPVDADLPPRGVFWLVIFTVTSLFVVLFPALFIGLTQWWPSPDNRGIFVTAGMVVVIGASANFLAMLFSHLEIGFGVSNSLRNETAFIFVIPAFQAFFGLASIVAGWSGRFGGWLNTILK